MFRKDLIQYNLFKVKQVDPLNIQENNLFN